VTDHACPLTVPEPIRPEARVSPCCPGVSQTPKAATPLGALKGVAAAISPCREYAVASTIPAPTGTANAIARTPYTATGCSVSTVPLVSRTATYVTSARTAPYCTWTGPRVSTKPDISEKKTGSALSPGGLSTGPTASAWPVREVASPPNAGPEVVKICSLGSGVPVPGLAAVSCQLWPSMVPDAIRPGAGCGSGAWTVTV